jgi:single-strand DNA-binding protein
VSDNITITGIVGTDPRALTTSEGLAITSFRLASTQRRFDKAAEKWIDGETNWYSITAFRQLAANTAVSVKKGERILVTGRLRVREWKDAGKSGTNIEVEAESLGHDLSWGTAAFSRSAGAAPSLSPSLAPGDVTRSEAPTEFPSESELAAPTPAAADDATTPF